MNEEAFYSKHKCVRHGKIGYEESHICYVCGSNFKSEQASICVKCGMRMCSVCGSCSCDFSKDVRQAMREIHTSYCCNRRNLLAFKRLPRRIVFMLPSNIASNVTKNLLFCQAKINETNRPLS